MEFLSDTKWDVVISGTGLQHSLLALALSRSDKKILHVDQNEYYGGSDAAFSLQEVDEWIEKLGKASSHVPFRNAALWKAEAASDESTKLTSSRAYTLTLSPQIIYTKSKLLSHLVSSKVYRQLEFQAVGNWWVFDSEEAGLKRLPSGREDIFQDKNIDNRAKRNLMKFLKFVVDYENQLEFWEAHAEENLQAFLSSKFQFPPHLQTVITTLTLSLAPPDATSVKWALPRIAQHLTSVGLFGPGFGAVVPKWGGGAEISQVACRAGAVGGGVYVLGTDITAVHPNASEEQPFRLDLSNGETVGTKLYVDGLESGDSSTAAVVSKAISVISSPLPYIFKSTVEGSPLTAVSVVVFPPNTLQIEGGAHVNPVYIMVHSSETGECPAGQCILYATTAFSDNSKAIVESALASFAKTVEDSQAKLLYTLYYEQQEQSNSPLDLSFNDQLLENVETKWREVIGDEVVDGQFMQFEERKGMEPDDDDDNEDY